MTISPAIGRVTSRYGPRKAPVPGASTFHVGVDIAAAPDSPIRAPQAGTIVGKGYTASRGNWIRVRHIDAETLHQHLAKPGIGDVGTPVGEGDIIGYMGATGNVSGVHLHTEVLMLGISHPIDPDPWYRARGVELGSGPIHDDDKEDEMALTAEDVRKIVREEVERVAYGGDTMRINRRDALHGATVMMRSEEFHNRVRRAASGAAYVSPAAGVDSGDDVR